MVRLLVRDIRDRRLVLEHQDQVSKVVRCHYTEDCLREVSSAETPRQSSELTFQLLRAFEDDAVVSVETLIEAGVVKNPRDGVKILGNGELTKKLTVQANAFSASAKEKIEALGGKAEVI